MGATCAKTRMWAGHGQTGRRPVSGVFRAVRTVGELGLGVAVTTQEGALYPATGVLTFSGAIPGQAPFPTPGVLDLGRGCRWGREKGLEPGALEANLLPSPTESREELPRDCPTSQSKDGGWEPPKTPSD